MEISEGGGRAHKRLGRFKRIEANGSGSSPGLRYARKRPLFTKLKIFSALRQDKKYVALRKERTLQRQLSSYLSP